MIKIRECYGNWVAVMTDADWLIGYESESGVQTRAFLLPGDYTDWTGYLDMELSDGTRVTAELEVGAYGCDTVMIWRILSAHTAVPGKLMATLRAVRGDKERHTNIMEFYVRDSVGPGGDMYTAGEGIAIEDGVISLQTGGDTLGGVKNGGNVTINPDGTMTAPSGNSSVFPALSDLVAKRSLKAGDIVETAEAEPSTGLCPGGRRTGIFPTPSKTA